MSPKPKLLLTAGNSTAPAFPPASRLSVFVYSLPGLGKSTWAASCPDAVIFDTEQKAWALLRPTTWPVTPRAGEELLESIEWLLQSGPIASNVKTVVIDTIDGLIDLIVPVLSRQCGVTPGYKGDKLIRDLRDLEFARGWKVLNGEIQRIIVGLQQAGYGVVLLGHAREETIGEGKEARAVLRPLLSDSTRGVVFRNMWMIGRLTHTLCFTKEGKRDPRHILNLTAPATTDTTELLKVIVKTVLTQYLQDQPRFEGDVVVPGEIKIDVEGFDGWSRFADRYAAACAAAAAARTTPPPAQPVVPHA